MNHIYRFAQLCYKSINILKSILQNYEKTSEMLVRQSDRNRFVFSSTEPAQQEDNIQNGQAKVIERHIPVQSSFIPNHLFPLHFYLSYIVFIHMTTFPACSNLKTLVAVRFSYV